MPSDTNSELIETRSRSVGRVLHAERTLEGAGFSVRRPFPTRSLDQWDPFLLLDEMGPMQVAPGEAKGAPDHPHRGFETVTYLLSGSFEHKDSQGHYGQLFPGDVQWMTAGSGVMHSEMPSREFQSTGGRLHGFQLWVNLPRVDKMMPPRYQDIVAQEIPTATSSDGKVWVRVIAGESLGANAVIDTRIPITYLHLKIEPGGSHEQTVVSGHTVFAYVFAGRGVFGAHDKPAQDGDMVMFDRTGGTVRVAVPADAEEPLQMLLLAGQPLAEPVVRYGPFVMNSHAEIEQAMADFRTGRMGRITVPE